MQTDKGQALDSELEYEAWFREKVQAALDDPRPGIPHDKVMDQTRAIIDRIAAQSSYREK
jgi:hypothetical protein